MSTNYYLVKNGPTVREPLHIGKSSSGWRFLFHDCDACFKPLDTFERWRDYLEEMTESGECVILDEYDEHVDYRELMDIIKERQSEPMRENDHAKNVGGYRFSKGRWS